MRISLSDAGKRFNRDWVFRHCTYSFEPGHAYAITGPNGSGKSTCLQLIAGVLSPSEGAVDWYGASPGATPPDAAQPGPAIDPGRVFPYIAFSAPYLEVVEEMTLPEFLSFHAAFKPWLPGVSTADIPALIGLSALPARQIQFFSSGMKQRVRLAQAIFSNTPILLLDEPCTNFDEEGYDLYRRLIAGYTRDRLVVVSSNDPEEYAFCREKLSILDYKTAR